MHGSPAGYEDSTGSKRGAARSPCLGSGLFVEGGRRHQSRRCFAVQGHVAVFKGLEAGRLRPWPSSRPRPSSAGCTQSPRVSWLRDGRSRCPWRARSKVMGAQRVGAIDRIGNIEGLLHSLGSALGKARQVLFRHLSDQSTRTAIPQPQPRRRVCRAGRSVRSVHTRCLSSRPRWSRFAIACCFTAGSIGWVSTTSQSVGML